MGLKHLLKDFSYTISSNFITLMISSLVILVLPKLLNVTAYGYWQLYIFYTTYVGIFHFGWADGVYLRYGGKKYALLDRKLFHSQFIMYSLLETFFSLIIIVLSMSISNQNESFIIKMTAISLIFMNVRQLLLYILQSTGRIQGYALTTIMDRLIYIVVVLVLLLVGIRNYKYLVLSDLIGKFISLIYAIYLCKDITLDRTLKFYLSFNETFKNIKVGINLLVANFASFLILGVIRYAVQIFWGIKVFGKISLTLSVSNLLITFITAISVVLFPTLRRIDRKNLPKIYEHIRDFLMLILFAGLLLYYPVNLILTNWLPRYDDALIYMAILFPMCVYEGKFELLINTFMKTLRMERILLTVNLITLFFSFFMSIVNIFFIKDLDVLMFSVIILLGFRSTLSELYIANKLRIAIFKDVAIETVIVLIFITSTWLLSFLVSMIIYGITYVLYFIFKHKKIGIFINLMKKENRKS